MEQDPTFNLIMNVPGALLRLWKRPDHFSLRSISSSSKSSHFVLPSLQTGFLLKSRSVKTRKICNDWQNEVCAAYKRSGGGTMVSINVYDALAQGDSVLKVAM